MDFLLPSFGLLDRFFLEFGSYGDGPSVPSSSRLYRAGTPTEYSATFFHCLCNLDLPLLIHRIVFIRNLVGGKCTAPHFHIVHFTC